MLDSTIKTLFSISLKRLLSSFRLLKKFHKESILSSSKPNSYNSNDLKLEKVFRGIIFPADNFFCGT